MARGDIIISIYQPPVPVVALEAYRLASPREPRTLWDPSRWALAFAAGTATLLLHLIFFASVEWGLGIGRLKNLTPPKTLVPGGRVGGDGYAMEWILIEDQDGERGSGTPRPLPDLEAQLQPVTLEEPPMPQITVEGEEAQAQANAAAAQAGSADLFGLYMHQVDARIERAWLRPRTPIGARQFSCSARIEQDEAGHVLEIRLRRCNGDARWQQSLIRAIRSASPLPFPPEPKVFRPVITLSFQAIAYSSTSEPELYEPVSAEREGAVR